jgi:ATP-dependent Clp protease ATP-binding subunit ClpA
MFQRFTREARTVVVTAHEEARAMRDGHIRAVHLVLAAARHDEGVAGGVLRRLGLDAAALRSAVEGGGDAAALASLGIDLDEVRRRVEAAFGEGALDEPRASVRRGRGGGMPFSPEAKKALEGSLREALALGDNSIRAEHVLLGAVLSGEPALEDALRRRGRTGDEIRAALLAAMREPGRGAA